MNGMRILGAVSAGILASSLGTLAACGGSPESKAPPTAQAVSAASVSIALFDQNGVRVGEGSGVMIAPRLVLTSGHLISGKYKWVVTSADGKQKVTGSRGLTYDWMKYDSNKAHPRKRDVGVIHLDESIKLAAYPKLVGDATATGTKATRIRGTGAGFQELDMTLAKYKSSPNAWLGDGKPGETLDTGGAVYDARGILGVVSGRGMTTGKLYVARIDGLVKWLAPKVACAGGATGTRTYAPPAVDKSKEICEDAGTGGGGSTGGGGNTSGGPSGGGGGNDGSGSCDGDDDGVCSGNCGGPSGPGGDGTPGSSGSGAGSSGSDGTSGSGGGSSGSGGGSSGSGAGSSGSSGSDGTSNPGGGGASGGGGPSGPGGDGTPGSGGGSSGSGSGAGSSGGNGNTGGGASGAPSGGAGGGESNETCQGPTDNPEVCPPEPSGCSGPSCGGGQPDDSIDYGNCACGSSGGGSIYLR
jgi:hypothetical protein